MNFRNLFLIPLTSETPTHRIKHGGPRRFVDQADREFELVSYNQHPYQLLMYQINNEELQAQNQAQEMRAAGEQPLEDRVLGYLQTRIEEEQEEMGDGQKISYDRFSEIFADALRRYYAEQARPGSGLDENGNFTDFLEQRRPFENPTQDGATH